jgi:recombinational DNA repair ATPase RecF
MESNAGVSLLDALAGCVQCAYLSDLRHMDHLQRQRVVRELESIRSDTASLREWNDALQYLTSSQPMETREEARSRLLSELRQRQNDAVRKKR